jgi:hypothetical protein
VGPVGTSGGYSVGAVGISVGERDGSSEGLLGGTLIDKDELVETDEDEKVGENIGGA